MVSKAGRLFIKTISILYIVGHSLNTPTSPSRLIFLLLDQITINKLDKLGAIVKSANSSNKYAVTSHFYSYYTDFFLLNLHFIVMSVVFMYQLSLQWPMVLNFFRKSKINFFGTKWLKFRLNLLFTQFPNLQTKSRSSLCCQNKKVICETDLNDMWRQNKLKFSI